MLVTLVDKVKQAPRVLAAQMVLVVAAAVEAERIMEIPVLVAAVDLGTALEVEELEDLPEAEGTDIRVL